MGELRGQIERRRDAMTDEHASSHVRRLFARGRRSPPHALAALVLVAVVLVVLVAIAGALAAQATGIVRQGPAASPAPLTVLDAGQLRAAIEAERAGGLAPRDVLADVAIEPGRRTPPLDRECVPLGQCTVTGTLAGFDATSGTVTVRAQDQMLPPPTDLASLQPPVALRLSSGPIEFLGHVTVGPADRAYDVPEALALTKTAANGEVIAATGWLVGVEGFSCGPVPQPGPIVPAPFSCQLSDFLTERASKPVSHTGLSGMGSGFQMHPPPDAVEVQIGAYGQFAPQPSFDGVNDVPRFGTYLLRMVAIDQSNCRHCRGWLAVGRLDPQAVVTSPVPSGYQPLVRSSDELAVALARDRSALVGQVVFVDGQIVPGTASGCTDPGPCSLGMLEGTTEQVVATPFVVSQFVAGVEAQGRNVLALLVRPNRLEYLGVSGTPLALSELGDPLVTNGLPLQMHPVEAWLVGEGAVPCASFVKAPPAGTPFDRCGGSWLTASAQQPVQRNGDGLSIVVPAGAIRVQPGAYDEFAPSPAPEPDGVGYRPREGTYLVRMVTWTPAGGRAEIGWQVIARLAP